MVARLLTGALGAELGQSVIVENIAGASGLLGWRNVAGASPDGYTLLMAENAIAIRPGFKDMQPPFDPVTQLDAVASVAHSPLALCVAENVPASSVKELIALSKSSSKKLNYASAGLGSVAQLVWEVVSDGAKIDAVTVPYRGGGPAMADVLAGQVELIMASSQVAKSYVEAKKIKALAVTGKQRSPVLPDVPTLAEAGVKHADVELAILVRRVRAQGFAGRREGEAGKGGRAHARLARCSRAAGRARHYAGFPPGARIAGAAPVRDQELE